MSEFSWLCIRSMSSMRAKFFFSSHTPLLPTSVCCRSKGHCNKRAFVLADEVGTGTYRYRTCITICARVRCNRKKIIALPFLKKLCFCSKYHINFFLLNCLSQFKSYTYTGNLPFGQKYGTGTGTSAVDPDPVGSRIINFGSRSDKFQFSETKMS